MDLLQNDLSRSTSDTRPNDSTRPTKRMVLSGDDLATIEFGLDTLESAIFMLDADGRLTFTNRAANNMLQETDVFVVDRTGVLRTSHRGSQRRFRNAIEQAHDADGSNESDGVIAVLTFERDFGLPLSAQLSYCANDNGGARTTRIIMFVRDPERTFADRTDRIVATFGVTHAEAQIVGRLVAGASLDEIAEERESSLLTVRNQLKSAKAKIGVCRQAELVSLVLRAVHF